MNLGYVISYETNILIVNDLGTKIISISSKNNVFETTIIHNFDFSFFEKNKYNFPIYANIFPKFFKFGNNVNEILICFNDFNNIQNVFYTCVMDFSQSVQHVFNNFILKDISVYDNIFYLTFQDFIYLDLNISKDSIFESKVFRFNESSKNGWLIKNYMFK